MRKEEDWDALLKEIERNYESIKRKIQILDMEIDEMRRKSFSMGNIFDYQQALFEKELDRREYTGRMDVAWIIMSRLKETK